MLARALLAERHAHEPQLPISLEQAMQDVLSVESAFVSEFLPYRSMMQLPPGFQAFAQWHFRRLGDEGMHWRDAAPAYALACLSHAAYGAALDPCVEWELELQWADLGELSRLSWPDARRLIRAAWAFLCDDAALASLDGVPAGFAAGGQRPEDHDDADSWQATELGSAYVVLGESLADRSPETWHTRGQAHWLSPDLRAICLAMSPALAVLESVMLQGFPDGEPRRLVRVAYPIALVRDADPDTLQRLHDDGPADVRAADRQRPADRWAVELRSPLLRVPSRFCPGEYDLLANVMHPDFVQLQRLDSLPLAMDRRRRPH